MNFLYLLIEFPLLVALGIAVHALLAHGVKVVLWAWSPLASGEPESFTYDRRVYHTAEPEMMQIIAIAAGGGALFWLGSALGALWLWGLGILAIAGAVALDVKRWERVASSAHHLWFQRGFGQQVHQVAQDDILDLAVEELEAGGFTLTHGRENRLVRLNVRLADNRVIALPKTDAYAGLDDVEAVANHLRVRIAQFNERLAQEKSSPQANADDDLNLALKRLRRSTIQRAQPSGAKPGPTE